MNKELIKHILPGTSPEDEVLDWVSKLTENDRKFIRALKKELIDTFLNEMRPCWQRLNHSLNFRLTKQHIKRVDAFMNKKNT
ncbi:MAG: hypothetical protein U5K71_09495 [Gracilimonas sp.]|nr:hypothetical protein [Gracilimonas sp.]